MSSNEDNDAASVKKKAHRPCDVCRRRKRRCDGGTPCGRCIKYDFSCTYEQRAMQRTTGKSSSYVQNLENRLKTVESLLRESNITPSAAATSPPDSVVPHGQAVEFIAYAIRGLNAPFPAPHSDDLSFVELAGDLDSLSLDNPGFQGKSSQAMLVKAAVDLKSNRSNTLPKLRRRVPLNLQPWSIKPWEHDTPRPKYTFPEDDLTVNLISLYFTNINIFFPLLHRLSFESAFATHLHCHDDGFAGTLLLVCALGARYSDDPRVHLPHVTSYSTAGWKYFDQVHLAGQPLTGQPTLYDLQCYCLAVQFLERTSGPRACWTLVGFGLRLAQDIGAHRQKSPTRVVTSEEELEKRAYWLMILFDAQLSTALGRSFAIQSHDFDLGLPAVVDDEYWEAGPHNAAFSQPPDTPSSVDFFVCFINLNRILAFALKILYSTNRIKNLTGMGDATWQEKVVVEFDSELTEWFESVPAHLRWDSACPNDVFFDQSAALHCGYYFVRIFIHRPFIPAIRRSSIPTSVPSLSICNTAARACIHVAEIHHQRRPNNPLVFGQTAAFTAGVVLFLNILGASRNGRVPDTDLLDVHRCINILRGHTSRWPSTGPLLDTLEQLVKIDQPPPASASHDNFEPSPFVTNPHGGPPATRAFHPVLYDPIMEGLFVGRMGEEPARAPQLYRTTPLYNPSMTGEEPARAPRPPVATGTTSAPSTPGAFDLLRPLEEPARVPRPPVAPDPTSGLATLGAFDLPNPLDLAHDQNAPMEMDTVAMWSAAPTGFEVSDWDVYLSHISEEAGRVCYSTSALGL